MMPEKWLDPRKLVERLHPQQIRELLEETWGHRRPPPLHIRGGIVYAPTRVFEDPMMGDIIIVLCETATHFTRYVQRVVEENKPQDVQTKKGEWILDGVRYVFIPIGGDVRMALMRLRPHKIVLVNLFLNVLQWQLLMSLFRDGDPNVESVFD